MEFKDFLDREEVADILKTYMDIGTPPGLVWNYLSIDLKGGTSLHDMSDELVPALYAWRLHMSEWMTFEESTVLSVEDAVVQASAYAFAEGDEEED